MVELWVMAYRISVYLLYSLRRDTTRRLNGTPLLNHLYFSLPKKRPGIHLIDSLTASEDPLWNHLDRPNLSFASPSNFDALFTR